MKLTQRIAMASIGNCIAPLMLSHCEKKGEFQKAFNV